MYRWKREYENFLINTYVIMDQLKKGQWSRRAFIGSTAAAVLSLAIPRHARAAFGPHLRKLTAGLISDLHQDVMHDAPERLEAFLDAMQAAKPDMLVQLGDFAYPSGKNKPLIDRFNNAHPVHLHVIGNHDTDSGFTHRQCIDVWGMPAAYYTKIVNGYRWIILNANEKGSPSHKGGYPTYVGPEQAAWLRSQLEEGKEPVIVVSHQPLAGFDAVNNAEEIQQIISSAKHRVVLAINGHEHIDAVTYVYGIPYLTINSASYFWVGGNYKHNSYSEEIHRDHPWIGHTCPYKDSLFTTLTIDPVKQTISVAARNSEWVGQSPAELRYSEQQPLKAGEEIVPFIRARKLPAKGRLNG